MKVLMTSDAVGGVWTYALELARALESHDVEILLATMGPRPSDQQRADAAACVNLTLVESDYRLEWMNRPWADVDAAGEWLQSLEAGYEPDVIHLNGFSHGAVRWQAPALVVVHSCVLSWWRAVRGEPAPPEWDAYRERVRAGLSGAAAVAAPTRALLESVLCEHLLDVPAQVIPNACSLEIPGRVKEPFILTVGRLWDPGKNVRALADIAPELDWPVLAAGWEASPGSADTALPNVRSLGKLPPKELAVWYARSSIFAHPALYEPFGLAPLEAARAGCALVLGDISTLREVWGDAADYVPPRDRNALRDAVLRLSRDTEYRRMRAAAAMERARRYEIGPWGMAYHELYNNMLRTVQAEVTACAS